MEAVGVGLVSSIGESVGRKLATFMEHEALLLLRDVGDDLKYIKDEVDSAIALLKDMSSQKIEESGEQFKQWMKQVKELIFEAEDIVDDYTYHFSRRDPPCEQSQHHSSMITAHDFVRKFIRQLKNLRARRRITSHLQKLKLQAEVVKERRRRYNFSAPVVSLGSGTDTRRRRSFDPRLQALFVQKDELVGIKEQRDMLIRWLVEDDRPQLRVIAVAGSGGFGKTTLVMQCYDSPAITGSGHFQCRAQITVSQSFDLKKLLKSLIKQLSGNAPEEPEKMEMVEFVTDIRGQLKDKRYVVVLDDIWTVDAWNALKCAFPDDGNGSRIIVTTRIDTVAHTCCSSDPPHFVHKVRPLSPEQSRELFCKRVFFRPSCPTNLKDLAEGILRKCGGMPLAIVTVAGILVANPERRREQWQRVHDHIGLEWDDGAKNMNRILMLSYDDLPDDVKPCFLYLSIFPEDWKIKRSDMMRRWIAEGFVGGGRDAEGIAKSNFDELINRNLIQPRIVRDGKVKRWRVHDLILEIIVRKAVTEQFAYIVDKDLRVIPRNYKIRRISVHEAFQFQMWNTTLDLSLIRSLSLSFGSQEVFGSVCRKGKLRVPNLGGCTSMLANTKTGCLDFRKMRLLRVLDLGGCWFIQDSHIELICHRLFLLKHLCLKDTGVSQLPESIRMLQNLQVLDIRYLYLRELPQSLIELDQLSHLLASSRFKGTKLPRGIGSMRRSLRVLEAPVLCKMEVLEELGKLSELQKLVITLVVVDGFNSNAKEKLHAALQSLGNRLSSLSITSCDVRRRRNFGDRGFLDDLLLSPAPPLQLETLKLEGVLSNGVPGWIRACRRLAKVSLEITELNQRDVERLKNLPSLVTLHLTVLYRKKKKKKRGDERGCEQIRIGPEGFANLKTLSLELDCDDIRVGFRQGALPHLEFLNLYYLGTGRLWGIQNLDRLKKISYKALELKQPNEIDELRRALEAHPNHPKLSIFPK